MAHWNLAWEKKGGKNITICATQQPSSHTTHTRARATNLLSLGEQALVVKLGLLAPRQRDARVDVVKPRRAKSNSRQFLGQLHLGGEIVNLLLLRVNFLLVRLVLFQFLQHLRVAVRTREQFGARAPRLPFPFLAAASFSPPACRQNFSREFCSDCRGQRLESCSR